MDVKKDDFFLVKNYRVAISPKKKSYVYIFKDSDDCELADFISETRPVIDYLFKEGFLTENPVKVAVLTNPK